MKVKIGSRYIGGDEPVFIVAEIGINHNGSVDIAKQLIDVAVDMGCDAVKFQKRTVDKVYNQDELDKFRDSPWGTTTREQKLGLEFGRDDYVEIDLYCRKHNILWFASCWNKDSVDFIDDFHPPCFKIPSPLLTDHNLVRHVCGKGKPVILSTGMSTPEEIDDCIKWIDHMGNPLVLLHCTSTYPCKLGELNLNVIPRLKQHYDYFVGYSGYEVGVYPSIAAVVLGAVMVERHITLDRSMYGSDQSSSLEPRGLQVLVSNIRKVPVILGDGVKQVYSSEIPIMKKLRKT